MTEKKLIAYPTPFLEFKGLLTLLQKIKKEAPAKSVGLILLQKEEPSPLRWLLAWLKGSPFKDLRLIPFGETIPEEIETLFFPYCIIRLEAPVETPPWFTKLLKSKREIIFSYPLMDSLGNEIRRSPWLEGSDLPFQMESPELTKIRWSPQTNIRSAKAKKLIEAYLEGHPFSPTELEAYQTSPFNHFARYLLHLEEKEEKKPELDPAVIGRLVHKLLEVVFNQLGGEKIKQAFENPAPVIQEGLRVAEEELKKRESSFSHQSFLWTHRKERILRAIKSFLVQEIARLRESPKKLIPSYSEWHFGEATPYSIKINSQTIRLRGVVDRIDIDPKEKRFLVIDYKTGSQITPSKEFEEGRALQLPLYVEAVGSTLLPGYRPMGGLFARLHDLTRKEGFVEAEASEQYNCLDSRSQAVYPNAEWLAILTKTKKKVSEILRKMQGGEFSQQPEKCAGYCEFRDICRCGT